MCISFLWLYACIAKKYWCYWKAGGLYFCPGRRARILLLLKFLNDYSTKIDTIPVDTGTGLVWRSICVSLGGRDGFPGASALLVPIRPLLTPTVTVQSGASWCFKVILWMSSFSSPQSWPGFDWGCCFWLEPCLYIHSCQQSYISLRREVLSLSYGWHTRVMAVAWSLMTVTHQVVMDISLLCLWPLLSSRGEGGSR